MALNREELPFFHKSREKGKEKEEKEKIEVEEGCRVETCSFFLASLQTSLNAWVPTLLSEY